MPNNDDQKILAWDPQTSAPTYVPLADYDALVQSGKVRPYEQSVVRTATGSDTGTAQPPDQGQTGLAMGEHFVSPEKAAAADFRQRQLDAYSGFGDKLKAFTDGVVDSVSLGTLHAHGPEADLTREANSGSNYLGSLVGLGLSLGEGPLSELLPAGRLAKGAEKTGQALADALTGERAAAGGLRAAANRAITEATTNAALAGAAATGHEVTDALIDDKDFAAEHIVHEAGFGALLGGGFGAASELFSRAAARLAKRSDIAAQGGVIDPASLDSLKVHDIVKNVAVKGWDDVVETHGRGVQALKLVADEMGPLAKDFIGPREAALKDAIAAREELASYDPEKVLASGDNELVHNYLAAVDAYGDKAMKLDFAMSKGGREMLYELKPRESDLAKLEKFLNDQQAAKAAREASQSATTNPGVKRAAPGERSTLAGQDTLAGRGSADDFSNTLNDEAGPPTLQDAGPPTLQSGPPTMGNTPTLQGGAETLPGVSQPTLGGGADTFSGAYPERGTPTARYESVPTGQYGPNLPEGATPQRPPLMAFAHDVEHAAAGIPEADLGAIHAEMEARGGSPPKSLDRFRELVNQAHEAGHLQLNKMGELMKSPRFARGEGDVLPPWSFRERFPKPPKGSAPEPIAVKESTPAPDAKMDKLLKEPTVKMEGVRGPGTLNDPNVGALAKDHYAGLKASEKAQAKALAEAERASAERAAAEKEAAAARKVAQEAEAKAKAAEAEAANRTLHDTTNEASVKAKHEAHEARKAADAAERDARAKEANAKKKAAEEFEKARTLRDAHPPKGMGRPGVKPGGQIDEFLRRMEVQGPRLSPGDRAAAAIRDAMDQLRSLTGGRLGAPSVANAAVEAGLKNVPRGPLAEQLANIWGLRQLADAAAEVGSKGKGASGLARRLIKSSAQRAGRAFVYGDDVLQSMKAHAVGVVAGHVVGAMIGSAAGLAASVGRARGAVTKAIDSLLNGRASHVVRAIPLAASYSYDGSPPTEDIHERVTQIQNALANPEIIRKNVHQALGDLAVVHPQLADAAANNAVRMLTNLSVKAPVFVWSALGDPRAVGERAIKQFREYEDVTHNPGLALDAIARGAISPTMLSALRDQFPQIYQMVSRQLLQEREVLAKLPEHRLRVVEQVLGTSLRYSGPAYILRQQAVYAPPQQAQPQKGAGAVKAPPATPAQSMAPTAQRTP